MKEQRERRGGGRSADRQRLARGRSLNDPNGSGQLRRIPPPPHPSSPLACGDDHRHARLGAVRRGLGRLDGRLERGRGVCSSKGSFEGRQAQQAPGAEAEACIQARRGSAGGAAQAARRTLAGAGAKVGDVDGLAVHLEGGVVGDGLVVACRSAAQGWVQCCGWLAGGEQAQSTNSPALEPMPPLKPPSSCLRSPRSSSRTAGGWGATRCRPRPTATRSGRW